jgi:hypothetical protein
MHSVPARDNLNLGPAIFTAVALTLVAFVVMAAVQWRLEGPSPTALAAAEAAKDPTDVRRLHAEQLLRLQTYRWIDRDQGVLAIPIDRAMELTVREKAALR